MMMSHLHSCFNQRLFSIHPTKHTVRAFINYDLLTDYHGARLIYRGTSTSGLCNTTGIRAASRIYRCGLSPSLGPHLRTWPSCRVQSSTHLKGIRLKEPSHMLRIPEPRAHQPPQTCRPTRVIRWAPTRCVVAVARRCGWHVHVLSIVVTKTLEAA